MSCIIRICGTFIQSAASTQRLPEKYHVTETLELSAGVIHVGYTDELDQLDMQLLLDDFITRNDYRRHTSALSNKSH